MKAYLARHPRLVRLCPPLLAGGLALLLYAATSAPGLTWAHAGADGGDLMAAAMTGGVPHPSGYPTYCLLGRAFAQLPLGSIAQRFNLFSAVAAAISVAVAACAFRRAATVWSPDSAPGRRHAVALAALFGALTWATGLALWGQATIAEVYGLWALFTALCLYLALRLDAARRGGRPAGPWSWALLGLAAGIGLGAHLALALLAPGLALLLWPTLVAGGARPAIRRLLALIGGLALGLGVYAYVPLAARGASPVIWGDPRDWAGFWWLLSGRIYHGYLFGTPAAELPGRALGLFAQTLAQYPVPTWLLAIYGLADAWRRPAARRLAAATTLIAATYLAYAVVYYTADSWVYLLPTHLMAALWAAGGALLVWNRVGEWTGRLGRPALPGYALAALAMVLLALLGAWAGLHLGEMDLADDSEARDWVSSALATLPADSLLITSEDGHTFAMAYAQWVEGARPDVLVVDADLWRHPGTPR
jgi:hypothetical protein